MDKRVFVLSAFVGLAAALCVFETALAHDQKHVGSSDTQLNDEAPFLAENTAAMDKMMAGMDVKPTGDIDADFTAMMIPHHQGAIDMAVAYLRYGKNEQLRRIAQEIVVEQQQEIAAMKLAVGQPLPPSNPAPTQPAAPALAITQHPAGHPHDRSMMTRTMQPTSQTE